MKVNLCKNRKQNCYLFSLTYQFILFTPKKNIISSLTKNFQNNP
jgi:hypothetical protein